MNPKYTSLGSVSNNYSRNQQYQQYQQQPQYQQQQHTGYNAGVNRNLHPDSTIFKNMPQQHSVASYGIIRKNVNNIPQQGLGINPNLRVEDEYINNLMKQIHFMNLEINLLNQKQEENKDVMGIRAILQRDKRAHTDHFIEAKDKFGNMVHDLRKKYANMEGDIFDKDQYNKEMEVKVSVTRKLYEEIQTKFRDVKDKKVVAIEKLRERLDHDHKNRNEITKTINKLKNNLDRALEENKKLKKFIGEKDLMDSIKREIDEDDNKILREEIAYKDQVLQELLGNKTDKEDEINKNSRLILLKEKNEDLLKKLKEKEKELYNIGYKCMQMEHLQNLAIKQKEIEADERRKLFEEHESLKCILEETDKANRLKVEKKIRDNESIELRKLDGILRKLQGELNEARVRYERIHSEFKKFKLDHYRKTTYLKQKENKNEKDQAIIEELEKNIKELEPNMEEVKIQTEDLKLKIGDLKEKRKTLVDQIRNLKENHSGLNSKISYIRQNFNLDNQLKTIDLEQLKGVMNSNMSINSTIEELLNKWDNIKRFGKGVPQSKNPI